MTTTAVDRRYPVGKADIPNRALTPEERKKLIAQITAAPAELRAVARKLDRRGLDTPYREGGWTARQVVHHVADSHMNAYIRFKLALTEDKPTIKPYDEAKWSELADVSAVPIESSLQLLEALNERWVSLLQSMSDADFRRELVHPEHGVRTLDQMLALYAWHGRHHVGHVKLVAQ